MGLVLGEGGRGEVRGGGMRKRSPTRSKIIKDLQSETTAVSDHITVCMLLRERTSSSTQSASFVSKTDSFKVSMIGLLRTRRHFDMQQVQNVDAAVLTCKNTTLALSLWARPPKMCTKSCCDIKCNL